MGGFLGGSVMIRTASFVSILLVAAVAAAAQAWPQHGGLASIANGGHAAVVLTAAMQTELRRAHVAPHARLLAVRGNRTFVRLGNPGNDHCYGVEKGAAGQFGFTCWDDFPSPAHPILDLSTFGAEGGGPIHLLDAEGVAADGVSTLAFVDAAGVVVGRVPVTRNVYSVAAPPQSTVRIVALDDRGRMLFAVPE